MEADEIWKSCKHLLCVRLDNIGDVLMSTPAMAAVKESFGCEVTLLTSSVGGGLAPFLDVVDDVIVYDAPWVKNNHVDDTSGVLTLTGLLKDRHFDGAIIFTTFSQNPLPAATVLYQAGIPLRLAYCRENPYRLITHWLPEKEPYTFVRHQVRRDLDLVKHIGATTANERVRLRVPDNAHITLKKLRRTGMDPDKPWLIVHAGVSEPKRQYPPAHWPAIVSRIVTDLGYQVVLTGTSDERPLALDIALRSGPDVFVLAGDLTLAEFITAVHLAPVVVSVNTAATHIAAGVGTPVVVLYAMTNPQHTPWKVAARVLPFEIPVAAESHNEVLRFTRQEYFAAHAGLPSDGEVMEAIEAVLRSGAGVLPETIDCA